MLVIKKMKNGFILMLCLLLSGSVLTFGQKVKLKRPPNPKIRALKIKVVTANMNLNAQQKKKFLPLYTQYSNEKLVCYRNRHALRHNKNSEYVVNKRLQIEKNLLQIKTKYKSRFLNIISAKQLEAMYQGERQFKHLLIKKLREGEIHFHHDK